MLTVILTKLMHPKIRIPSARIAARPFTEPKGVWYAPTWSAGGPDADMKIIKIPSIKIKISRKYQ
jgi:hypothetical protein